MIFMDKIVVFFRPLIKKFHIQPTFKNKPFGKGFSWLIIKIGFKIIAIQYKPHIKFLKVGDLSVS